MKTSIVIVNYKTEHVLTDCVSSVFKYENRDDFEIIIVDNASNESSKTIIDGLVNQYHNIKALYLDGLKSFSFANNRGIEIAQGEYILIMNPDIIFESPLFNVLMKFLESNPDTAVVAPALIGIDGKFQKYYYLRYPTIRQFIFFHSIILRFFFRKNYFINNYLIDDTINADIKKIYYIKQVPGAFFFTTRKVLDEIGLLDENLMLFFEDVDISYRINKKYRLALNTGLHVKHLGGTSFKEFEWWVYGRFNSSMIYFFKKHYSKFRYLLLRFIAVSNAYFMLTIEHLFKLFGKKDDFRMKKYKNFLQLVKEI